MNKRRALLNEYDNVIQNVTAIAETRDKLLVSYNSIPKNEIDRLSKILPDKIDTVRLAIDLDSIASRYAIAIKNVQVGNTNDKDSNSLLLPGTPSGYEKATISFSFISNYENFMSMLTDLEKSLRIMNVKSVTFKITETGLYEFHVVVETYWVK